MPSLLEREIGRAVDKTLAAASAARPPSAPRRSATPPVVRFSPLLGEAPPAARRGRRILLIVSVAAHVLLFAVLLLMPRRAQTIMDPFIPIEIVFTAPVPSIPETLRAPVPPRSVPKPKPRPEPRDEPPPPVAKAPDPVPTPAVPEIEAPPVAKIEPPRPRPVVRTGLLDETPAGPAIVASKASRSLISASGFDGSATAASSPARPGRVMEAAFDTQPTASRAPRGTEGVVRATGFGEETAAAPRKRERAEPAGVLDTEVEILAKPKPVYTDEARALRLEGDVVLDVTFEASGGLRILGVAQGLGHGLDEAAIDAAKRIRFNPAKRDGSPVDYTAKLRVVFRLA